MGTVDNMVKMTNDLTLGVGRGSSGFTKTEYNPVKEMEEQMKLDCKYTPPDKPRKNAEECKANFIRVKYTDADTNSTKFRLSAVVKALKSSKSFTLILLDLMTDTPDDPLWQLHDIHHCDLNDKLGQELITKISQLRSNKEPEFDWYVTCKIYAGQKIKMTKNKEVTLVELDYITIT